MKYAIQAAAAVLSAGAYGLVKAQEEKKHQGRRDDAARTPNLRKTIPHSDVTYNTEKHGAQRFAANCAACHTGRRGLQVQGVPSHGRLLVSELIQSFADVCPFDTKGIPGSNPMTGKFVAPVMDKDNCDCCISDYHGGEHWTKKTLSKFLQDDINHGDLSDLHASHIATRIVKTHCPKQKRGKAHKTNKSSKSKRGKGVRVETIRLYLIKSRRDNVFCWFEING